MNPYRRTVVTLATITLAGFLSLSLGNVRPAAPTGPGRVTGKADPQTARPTTSESAAVLVELFTSEGCSTCPPADKLLTDLDQTQPIEGAQVIALSEHVDYWNHLGWKDPFSSAEFTRRQTEYARQLGTGDIYTPQMVVDGRIGFVGSNAAAARDAITKAARSPRATVGLTFTISSPTSLGLTLRVKDIPDVSAGDQADVWLAITEGRLMNNVLRGENSGRKLAHSAVTRKLVRIGTARDRAFSAEHTIALDPHWKRQDIKVIAFLQERSGRRVLGATAIQLNDSTQ
jgi:hypothetical protein